MKQFLILLLLVSLTLTACDDSSSKKESTCDPTCKTWEACGEGLVCSVLDGRCNSQTDCEADGMVCNTVTNTCEVGATCNDTKTPSTIGVFTDSCGDMTDCLDSSDCPENYRCESLNVNGLTEHSCCVKGRRGCQESGTICGSQFDCESGLCVNRNGGPYYCTHQCAGPEDCADPISDCASFVGFCLHPF